MLALRETPSQSHPIRGATTMGTGTVAEDESVTDLYTTDGGGAGGGHGQGLGAASGAGTDQHQDDLAFRSQVQAEQEQIFRDYELEVPVGGGSEGTGSQDVDEDSVLSEANTSVLLPPTPPEGHPLPRIVDDLDAEAAEADANAGLNADADARSVLTDNPLFRANVEAEERKLMAEFDFDYSVQSSFDVFDAPVPLAVGTGTAAGTTTTAAIPTQQLSRSLLGPFASSVALTANNNISLADLEDDDLETGARDHDLEYADATSTLPEEDNTSATSTDDASPTGARTPVGVVAASKPSKSLSGQRPASSAATPTSSFPLFHGVLKLLLPTAYGNRSLNASSSTSITPQGSNLRTPPPIEAKRSTGTGSHSSPTDKTLTPTASDSKHSPHGSPNRDRGRGTRGVTETADEHSNNLPPPSIIILGTVPTNRSLQSPGSRHEQPVGGGGASGNVFTKTMRRLWGDWLGRVILLLLLAILLSIAVAVGALVVYRNSNAPTNSAAASGESANAGKSDDFLPQLTPAPAPNQPPVKEEIALNRTQPPKEPSTPLWTTAPTKLRATAKPTSRPTIPKVKATPAPSAAPTVAPIVAPPPPEMEPGNSTCHDSTNATFFINSEHGFQNCAFLSTNQGIKQLLCQAPYDPSKFCPATCETCGEAPPAEEDGAGTGGTTKPPTAPTPSPTVDETTAAAPNVTAPADNPTPSPTSAATATDDNSSLRNVISSVAPDSVLALLDESGSSAEQALQWLEQEQADGSLESLTDAAIVQRFAVAAFGYATGVDQWSTSSSWLSMEECSWFGIGCDDAGVVTSLELSNNRLTGSLPPELALLSSSLVLLDVSENQISGSFPSEFGLLSQLDTLLVDNNLLLGSLPSEIGLMTSLTTWHIEYNDLTGSVPDSIQELTELQELYLWHNDLEGTLPAEVCFDGLQLMLDCRKVEVECWTRCYYQCGGSTGVPCEN